MALVFILLLAVCCVQAITADEFSIDKEELEAIQERLARLEGIEKAMQSMSELEENREENCLREGSGCSFASGPNCCGLRTRCIIMDHYTPQRGGPAKWHSVCREYKGGVAVDEIIKFFKRLG